MVIIKRLHTFMLQRFLPLLAMTFFICLFILLMHFLWRYIDELVGKGLQVSVIGELFYYAGLTLTPTALPLAILLASLMTFGNLGEKFELTALKAAGISLFNIMKPLIVLMLLIAIGAFFFQNNVLPMAQAKMYTILFSVRAKSPEMEIIPKSFSTLGAGRNIYVENKDPETGMLYDMIIYDTSQGMENSNAILADSGFIRFTEDKKYLFMHLYDGEMFQKMTENALGSSTKKYLPFRRESFTDKQIYIPFDVNLNLMDDSVMGKQYVGKNIEQLSKSIDSLNVVVNDIGDNFSESLKSRSYVQAPLYERVKVNDSTSVLQPVRPMQMAEPLDIDSIFASPSLSMAKTYVAQALIRAKQTRDSYSWQAPMLDDQMRLRNRHGIELQKKYTLSLACLIFFFIGAPLGAIIKKGGIGTPLIISVFLFIFYYIIDNTGYKMARDSKLEIWAGVWLSSAVLLPLGIFFTYKAIGDSAVFNLDAYTNFFKRLIGKHPKRTLEVKEVIMTEVETDRAIAMLRDFIGEASVMEQVGKKRNVIERLLGRPSLSPLTDKMTALIDYLSNSRDAHVIALLNEYPFTLNYRNLSTVITNSKNLLDRFDANALTGEESYSMPIEEMFRLSLSKMLTDSMKSWFHPTKKGKKYEQNA